MRISIRWRLTLWYALVMVVAFSILSSTTWYALRERLITAVKARLEQRLEGMRRVLRNPEIETREQLTKELDEFFTEIPDTALVQVRDRTGGLVAGPERLPIERSTMTTRIVSAGEAWEVSVSLPLAEQFATLDDLRRVFWLLIPGVLLVACAVGWWLSSRALRPVDEITAAASSISLQNLSSRVPVLPTGDEIERMARAWNEVLARLETAVERIRQFTADASHELRSPLANIRATADLALGRERDPADYRQALAEIQLQAEQMTRLTESLLTIARADFDGFPLQLEPTDLNAVVAAEVQHQQTLATEKGIALTAATNGLPAKVSANAAAIQRLLRILIDNAIRHTPNGGSVTVSAHDRILAVQDTGEGIAPGDLPHIFERFYRADRVRTSGSGFGLGLSIAQSIAQAHNTTIQVQSAVGKGSRFWMRFS
ncbi:MAG TPA: ATP-binding protein [Candidatus Solibacter sp.]|nr:ATP-binding protein [Candidatus Solibacter sp.]